MSPTKKGIHFTEEIIYPLPLTVEMALNAIYTVYGCGSWTRYGHILHHLMGDIGVKYKFADVNILDLSEFEKMSPGDEPTHGGKIAIKSPIEFNDFGKFPSKTELVFLSVVPGRIINLRENHGEIVKEIGDLESRTGVIEFILKKLRDPKTDPNIVHDALTKAQSALVYLRLRGKEKEPIADKIKRNLEEYQRVRDLEIRIERPHEIVTSADLSNISFIPTSDRLILGVDYVVDEVIAEEALEKLVNCFS